MAVRVELSPKIEAILARAAAPQLEDRANAVLRTAELIAPVDTGAYKRSLRKIRRPDGGWRIRAGVNHAVFVEFGTRRMHGYRTLGNALDSARSRLPPD